jgi:lipoprotein
MKGVKLQCVMLSAAMVLVFSIGCVAQTPRLAEFTGSYQGMLELDIEAKDVRGNVDAGLKRELDERDWEEVGVAFTVENAKEKSIYVSFKGAKLKLDLRKIKSEKDDGVLEHEALFALDATSVRGKNFTYKSADGDLELNYSITGGKTELTHGVRTDSEFELPRKKFEGEYRVDCVGKYKGEEVRFTAKLEVKFSANR